MEWCSFCDRCTDLVLVSNLCEHFASVFFSKSLIGAQFPWFLKIKKSKYGCYMQKPMHLDFAKSIKKECKSRQQKVVIVNGFC